mgnify:CR=1 FL=1
MIVVKFLQLNPTRDLELLGYLPVKSWIFSQFHSWIILIAVMELFCYTTEAFCMLVTVILNREVEVNFDAVQTVLYNKEFLQLCLQLVALL